MWLTKSMPERAPTKPHGEKVRLVMSTTNAMIARAEATHAQYPQYAGYWDTWQAATVTRDIKSRGAVVARKGDRVLCNPVRREAGFVTAFLPDHYVAGGCNTSVRASFVRLD